MKSRLDLCKIVTNSILQIPVGVSEEEQEELLHRNSSVGDSLNFAADSMSSWNNGCAIGMHGTILLAD